MKSKLCRFQKKDLELYSSLILAQDSKRPIVSAFRNDRASVGLPENVQYLPKKPVGPLTAVWVDAREVLRGCSGTVEDL